MTAAQNITQLFTGFPKWPTTTITYSFITEYALYTPEAYKEPGGPTVLSEAQKQRRSNSLPTFKAFLASGSSKNPKTIAKTK